MKLTLLLFLLTVLSGIAADTYSQSTKLTLKLDNVRIEDLLSQIEDKSEFRFFYNEEIDLDKKVSVNSSDETLVNILDKIFHNTGIRYEVIGRQVILTNSSGIASASQQQKTVNGKVTDSSGAPLPGVTVVVKGTTQGIITDADGKYSLANVSADATLVFSFVGMKSQEIAIEGKTNVNVTLIEETIGIEEVVAVGYGTQKKGDLTGAISRVKAGEIKTLLTTNSTEALQGMVAGVEVTQTSGRPGSNFSVRIRGNRSLNPNVSGEPLYIVDGIPIANINLINPADIETMDILKDASATSIFGFRGSNGVVIITTKRSKSNQIPLVTYEGYEGLEFPSFKYDVMNGTQFKAMKDEANRSAGLPFKNGYDQVELDMVASGKYTDWQELVTQTGYKNNHQITMSGGSDRTQYFMSISYYNERGIVKTDEFKRYSFRINLDQKINDFIKLGTSTFLVRNEKNAPDIDAYTYACKLNPLSEPYDINGNLLYWTTSDLHQSVNPLIYITDGDMYFNKTFDNQIFSNLYAEISPFKWMKYRINFAPQLNFGRNELFNATEIYQQSNIPFNGNYASFESLQYNLDNIITIDKKWKDIHAITVTLLQSLQSIDKNEIFNSFSGIRISSLEVEGMNPQTSSISNYYTSYIPNKILSFMSRVNYGFKEKYLLTIALRSDGASVLSENNKWDYFPSGALAWNIYKENFMKNISTINNLRLRISYGLVGNASVPPFTTLGVLKTTNYSWDESIVAGYAFNTLPNKALKWEKTENYNTGIDFSIFGNRISGEIEAYISNTRDILLNRKPIPSSGYSSTTVNLGKVQNKGIEITLNALVVDNRNFKWKAGLSLFSNKEAIVDLYGDQNDDIGNRWFIGHPIRSFYDYKKIGIWQLAEEAEAALNNQKPGDIKVQNLDSNPTITAADMQIIGSPNPKFSAGFNTKIEYKNFELSLYAFARFGSIITSSMLTGDTENLLNGRNNNYNMDYWTPENPTNEYPRPYFYKNLPYSSTLRYWDGTFIKLKNITLAYNAPNIFTNKKLIKSLRVLFTIQNPLRWSKYPYDPEALSKSIMVTSSTPTPRTFLLGLNVSL